MASGLAGMALLVLVLASAGGWALAALPPERRDALSVATTTLALGAGLLTLAMLGIALAAPGRLALAPVVAVLAATSAIGWVLDARGGRRSGSSDAGGEGARPRGMHALIVLAVVACCAAILVGGASWPFSDGDALAVYAPLGRMLAAFGTLPVGERFYESYPMLVPMLDAFGEWLARGPNEYVSLFAAALLALGAVLGAGWLARELRSARAGWIAAALLVSSPVFGTWATTGYADVPAGFFVVLVAVFAWRWRKSGDMRDALLAGAMSGLAMWTKNSALTLALSAPLLFVLWARVDVPRPGRRGVAAAAALAAAVVVAAPWYLHDAAVFGFLVPPIPSIWTELRRHDLASLLVLVRPAARFGLLGGLGAAAVGVALVRVARRRSRAPAEALLLALFLPFFAAWFWLASYDPRFLVTFLPLLAGFAAAFLDEALERLEASHEIVARRVNAALPVALLAGMPFAMRPVLPHAPRWLPHPFMNDLARHRLRVGGLFELGQAIDSLPEGSRIAGVPAMARYYLDPRKGARIAWAGPDYGPNPAGYDYEVRIAPPRGTASPVGCAGRLVFRSDDGYLLCRVVREVSDGGAR